MASTDFPFPRSKRIKPPPPYDDSTGSSSEEEEDDEEEESSGDESGEVVDQDSANRPKHNLQAPCAAFTVAVPALDGSTGPASRKLSVEVGKGIGRKWKRVKVNVVLDGGGGGGDEGDNRVGETMMWEDAMVKLIEEKFGYQEDYVRLKIASLNKSTRDLLVKEWFNAKMKLDKAIVSFSCAEYDCLQALLPS